MLQTLPRGYFAPPLTAAWISLRGPDQGRVVLIYGDRSADLRISNSRLRGVDGATVERAAKAAMPSRGGPRLMCVHYVGIYRQG